MQGLRELTTKYGALLVFDEVMTGFRISYGGAQVRGVPRNQLRREEFSVVTLLLFGSLSSIRSTSV